MDTPVRVLVVDDDPGIRAATGRVLEQAGYRVDLAADGAGTLAALQTQRPDLILLDRRLPDLDGLDLCRQIKLAPAWRDIFVILVSGIYTKSAQQIHGLEAGADGYLSRPLGNQELLARVQVFVRILRLQRSLRRQTDELSESNESLRRARQAALNLLEDAVADRERAECNRRALQESEQRFRRLFEHDLTGDFLCDGQGRFLTVNPAFCRMLGLPDQTAAEGHQLPELFPSGEAWLIFLGQLQAERRLLGWEGTLQRPDGSQFLAVGNFVASQTATGELLDVEGYLLDDTARKLAENRLARQNRLYQMLSRVNEAIVRDRDAQRLFHAVCRIAVEQGGFGLAAVVAFDTPSGQARVLAQAGDDDSYFASIAVNLGDPRLNCGTIATAFRTGRHDVCNDFARDPRMAAWQARARQRGYLSSASFPIRAEAQVCAVLVLLAGEVEYFQEEEIQLLLAVAEDLSYALDAMTDEQRRREAEAALRASLEEKNLLLQEIHHRVKNNLQVVSSLVNLQAAGFRDTPLFAALQQTQSRIRSMALLHETLYRAGNLARVDLRHYVETLCSQLWRTFGADTGARVSLDLNLAPVALGLDQAVPCGLILNELLTNALKYAFPAGRAGRIVVCVREWPPADGAEKGPPQASGPAAVQTPCIEVSVGDDGVGLPADCDPRQSPTLGLQLVRTLVEQLRGNLEIRRTDGTQFLVTFCPKAG